MTRQRLAALLLAPLLLLALPGCDKVQDRVFAMEMSAEYAVAGLQQANLAVDDINWVYLKNDWQDGRETVVLLHGFSADRNNWTRFAAELGDTYNLLIPDLPGHGETTSSFELPYDVDTQARRVLSLTEALGIDKFHLAGNSMGGAISARAAWLAPGRVLTLGLFNAAGAHQQESEFDAALAQGTNPLIVKAPEDMERVIAFAMSKPPFMPWPVQDVMARRSVARAQLNEKIFADLRRDNSIDQMRILPEVVSRTLVLWGDQDRLLHVANADLFVATMPNARKVVLAGIGHLPMLEAPAESARVYREFLAGQ